MLKSIGNLCPLHVNADTRTYSPRRLIIKS